MHYVARFGDCLKILAWDCSGFWVLYKRLEQGTFAWPTASDGPVEMASADLALLLAGVDLAQTRQRRWYERVVRARRVGLVPDRRLAYAARVADTPVTDLTTAQAMIASLRAELTVLQRENASLRRELDVLCQRLYGKKSEQVDPRQLQLALEQLANEPGAVTEPLEMDSGETPVRGHARRRPTGRRPLPASLPRQRVEVDVAEADKRCACGADKTRIGETTSEKLEYTPASFSVIVTARAKYACPRCHEGVVEAPAPPQAIEKSLAAEGLLAHVIISKYQDHLPLYRLERIFAREGIDLPRSTLCGWVADVATALTPIGEQLRRDVPKSPVGDAVRYLTNQWGALQRYVDDGRVAIDNNRAENQLRVVAVGRNYVESSIMRSRVTVRPRRRLAVQTRLSIIQRRSRKAKSSSDALKRPGATVGGATRASARSFIVRSASR
jgi:transposase